MRRVNFTDTAQSDLEEIWWYIAQDNPDRADSFVDKLAEVCRSPLASMPTIGKPCEELLPELWRLPYRHYLLFYRFNDESLEVVRVLHGARDIEAIFRDDV
ncbi:MAG: type II toxin-antitoxin system RelE/ParE family toxin [Gammaproteobacteria bacterium]|nr:type II toxin-antitoxin system RelE/ParE family toxin [Gammaproteobacteria bacterium]